MKNKIFWTILLTAAFTIPVSARAMTGTETVKSEGGGGGGAAAASSTDSTTGENNQAENLKTGMRNLKATSKKLISLYESWQSALDSWSDSITEEQTRRRKDKDRAKGWVEWVRGSKPEQVLEEEESSMQKVKNAKKHAEELWEQISTTITVFKAMCSKYKTAYEVWQKENVFEEGRISFMEVKGPEHMKDLKNRDEDLAL